MTTYSSSNGQTVRDEDAIRDQVARLLKQAGYRGGGDISQVQLYLRLQDDGRPIHEVKRHPEDPGVSALHLTASEVCDPELIRKALVDFGISMQAVGETAFGEILDWIVDGITGTRVGAITGPAQVAAGEQQKTVKTTDNDVAAIVADGNGDALKADRLEGTTRPRLEDEIRKDEENVARLTEKRDVDRTRVAEGRKHHHEREPDHKPKLLVPPRCAGDLMQWVALPVWLAVLAVLLDVGNGIFTLQAPISNVVNTSEWGSYALAIGVSVVLGLASALAGFALAAIRLPGRIVGAIFVAAFIAMMVELVTGLDALRLSEPIGAETLTVATVASCYVSALTGYAIVVWRDYAPQRAVLVAVIAAQTEVAVAAAGSELGDAVKVLQETEVELEAATESLTGHLAKLDELDEEIERLRDSEARVDVVARRRESQGIVADVETATIIAVANTHIQQEVAATKLWGRAMAWAAWRKTRAEELPEGYEIREPGAAKTPAPEAIPEEGLTALQKAAIVSLLIGALSGMLGALTSLAVGVIVMAAAAAIAAVLLLLGARRRRPGAGAAASPVGWPAEPVRIVSPADESGSEYREQPSYMVPKYRSGGPAGGKRQ